MLVTAFSSGNVAGGETPVPIPNTEVKPFKVDGTAVARLWESRKLPVLFNPRCFLRKAAGVFYF